MFGLGTEDDDVGEAGEAGDEGMMGRMGMEMVLAWPVRVS
jgi:hypothetical protein